MGNRGAVNIMGAGATAEISTEESVKGLVSVVSHSLVCSAHLI